MLGRRSLLVALLAVTVGLYLLPSPIDPKPHVLKGPPPALEGPLAVNTLLQGGRRLFSGKLHGPESFTADESGNVYTGTVDGKLWRIGPDDSLTFITQMGQNLPECGSSTDFEPVCGRPHGVRLDRRGQLIVADSYFGLHSVDPETGEKTLLVASSEGAGGVPFAFLNGLEISSETGIIYFTDSSSRWGRRHVKLEVIELNSLGRLLSYDPRTGSVAVLLDSLYMPNGVVLSPDESFLLLAETSIGRILRYWLKGPKAGTKEVVLDNMIGYPDNIRLSDRGTFLVGITTPRFRKFMPPFLDMIAPYPAVKRFLAKVVPLSFYNLLLPRYALVLELGLDGDIVGTLHDPGGRLTWAVSDVFQHRGRTYLGNTDLPFLPVLEDQGS
ncbi:adipocyte plasma membrane-associated protein [Mugil cephalus]|uniref:adipocyte plasma membrane-associated protein n=1 Tax=Mugil cephalus TaxID=48193 RepID=UPI001FB7C3F1|nr:adipocyte plasma membrane-associated protein [Mugil cephalus]